MPWPPTWGNGLHLGQPRTHLAQQRTHQLAYSPRRCPEWREPLFLQFISLRYPEYRQLDTDVVPLREEDAFPAAPQDAYGWEKLVTELLCGYYAADHGIETRVLAVPQRLRAARSYEGGREKAPAALCRKIALAEDGGEIEVWGDGKQTRSFCYVDDRVEGIMRTMRSSCRDPLDMGTDHLVSIDELPT